MSRTKRWFFIYIPSFIVVVFLFLHFENNAIGVTNFKISTNKLPSGAESFKIVQLSDLQSKQFGKNQKPLLEKVDRLDPDIIVVTGDLVDGNHYDEEASLSMMLGVAEIAPVYFIVGNHEFAVPSYPMLEKKLIDAGVIVLRNAHEVIPLGDGVIRLIGVDDPMFNQEKDGDVDKIEAHLDEAIEGLGHPEAYTVLLSHRPELFDVYAQYNMDLSLTGHAHGGQIRIPFVGGMFAPGQGWWPKYFEGIHESGQSSMIVSRGLGNSSFSQRLFNRPEIVVVELKRP
ncbi:metallophosphoesterase [Paenibacillus sp. L3-i20]|uniref:metallophosphoesterase n=1 Tax=Paenibacillus sp. L3-i20 TaxID=2905833 RepID=UPI001EDF0E92|nr:metallophosphoesterase [Paenibacillus sp. L3-i20]GKU76316.1 phosphoesterase [Paenibacillus sp. L3-i20]